MQNLSYRYKLSILVTIIFPCLSRLALQESGVEYELSRDATLLGIGGSIGYLIGYLFDKWQKALQLSKQTNLSWGKKVKEQRVRETWYTALF